MVSDLATRSTRSDFVEAATRLFASRGFYGTSIASVATELALTKQALIHHFGTKERLYGEVLARVADRMSGLVARTRTASTDPQQQLEDLFLGLYHHSLSHPDDAQLLTRELLDNGPRAEQARNWYLKDFFDTLVEHVRQALPSAALTQAEAYARVYALLGAIRFFVISQPTLRRMVGKAGFTDLKEEYPQEIRRLVRSSFAHPVGHVER